MADTDYELNPRRVAEELFALRQRVATLESQVETLALALADREEDDHADPE